MWRGCNNKIEESGIEVFYDLSTGLYILKKSGNFVGISVHTPLSAHRVKVLKNFKAERKHRK